MKTLILYAFHQYNAEVEIFLKRGLIQNENYTFIIVSNGDENLNEYIHYINKYNNVYVFERRNIGYDFGGWNDALFLPIKSLNQKIIKNDPDDIINQSDHLYKYYDKFICLNSSVSGPYLAKYNKDDWITLFTCKLSYKVKLTGISLNYKCTLHGGHELLKNYYSIDTYDFSHIQSMAFSFDRQALDIFINYKLFQEAKVFPADKLVLIAVCEVGMSTILLHEGYSLFSYMIDQGIYSKTEKDPNIIIENDRWNEKFQGVKNPFLLETMFVKINRGMSFPEKGFYDSLQ